VCDEINRLCHTPNQAAPASAPVILEKPAGPRRIAI